MITKQPLVSVIVPVYNAQETIDKCLTSILNQTFTDYEILLMNDGSTDGSLQVLREYEARYPFIRVIDKPNEGVAKTRNQAMTLAYGEFVMFIDNDDYIDEDYIETFYNAIKDNNLDIVVGGYRRVSNSRVLFEVALEQDEWSKYTVISPWAKIYRKKFLLEHRILFLDYILGEDVYFNLSAYAQTDKVRCIPYVGYNWYDNVVSVSNTIHKGFKKEADILYLFNRLDESVSEWNPVMVYYLQRFFIYYLLYSGRTVSRQEFMRQYRRVMDWFELKGLQTSLTPLSSQVKSERFSVKFVMLAFRLLQQCNLVSVFATCYCKERS